MKLKKLYQILFNRLLVVSYAGLLIFIAILLFVEYKETRDARTRIKELIRLQSQKQINDINQYIFRVARRKEISSYIVIALLLVLGINIVTIVQRLRRSKNKYRLLFNIGSVPQYFIDSTNFRILEVNQAAINNYGYSKQELLNMSAFDLCHSGEIHKKELINDSLAISKPGKMFEHQTRHSKKNGEVVDVHIRAVSIFLNTKKIFLITANDITEKEKIARELTKARKTAQEDERRELAAELHDNICQVLATSQLYLDMTKEKDAVTKDKYIQEARKYINLALSETRNISHRMIPSISAHTSLVELIDNLLVGMNPDNSLQIEFRYDANILWHKAPTDLKLNLYRICQEQLHNVRKYSKATKMVIELELLSSMFRMNIYDNGIGFDITKEKGGIGMMNMKNRAESFSGTFVINSSPNNGCTIQIDIPLMTICNS